MNLCPSFQADSSSVSQVSAITQLLLIPFGDSFWLYQILTKPLSAFECPGCMLFVLVSGFLSVVTGHLDGAYGCALIDTKHNFINLLDYYYPVFSCLVLCA